MANGKPGAPFGNQNSVGGKQKRWIQALDRAIAQDSSDRLRQAAEQLLDQAAAGEQWAIKELGDRLDGKPSQTIEATVDASITVEITRFAD